MSLTHFAEELIVASFASDVTFQPTGDLKTDMVLTACCGKTWQNYNGEIEVVNAETAWANAVLSGKEMPLLDIDGQNGYELTHLVFYSTDFGRRPIVSESAMVALMDEANKTDNPDLLCEIGAALKSVGGTPTKKMIDAAKNPMDRHHELVAELMRVI